MRFIIDSKVYDTEKSERIIKYKKEYPLEGPLGLIIEPKYDTILYRTRRGNWFSVAIKSFDKKVAYKESNDTVKKLFKSLNEVELYNKYFGTLEEA
ncbi:hypothetical protein [Clostridium luticellarii]|jgi:hypothetical protein|uniref:Uncharacterized protein n=1 Tax=Clostridium luticellarii TaxID=1691940 RepID=A0A2T0BMS2_9CLOT|nr:hypothetical protein [Clostridium luticellarii]MCI1944050.1 hypothetical protein [Clostridium luticellarii]MCI1967309.1 hypothetical protein [Clostridium luticellarii]MCI1995499.1 hypothetical protein [Clostridium luticellarii]MCI2039206.1 hypothetical protein [Clostridium luticellarii]PRR85166.1 hypothetical protein CLLU_18100 [Clostridium luticellarii]